jgi:hypothetical protein
MMAAIARKAANAVDFHPMIIPPEPQLPNYGTAHLLTMSAGPLPGGFQQWQEMNTERRFAPIVEKPHKLMTYL